MKIAVLSDVHGNLPALQAVLDDLERWGAERVVVNGDLVSRGPCSRDCLDLLAARVPTVHLLRGNHENFVIRSADAPAAPGDWDYDIRRFADWTCRQLDGWVEALRGWADHIDLTGLEGGSSLHVTHGSRLGDRAGILPESSDEELAERLGDPRDLFVGSHTHRPLIRDFNGSLVVNTGSVGQPLDDDPRAAYGRLVFHRGEWQAEIARVPFDRARALRDCHDSGFVEEGGPVARLILREMEEARAHVGPWRRRYMQALRDGELEVAASVEAYLGSL